MTKANANAAANAQEQQAAQQQAEPAQCLFNWKKIHCRLTGLFYPNLKKNAEKNEPI